MDFKDKIAVLGKIRRKEQPVTAETKLRRLDRVSLMELIVDQRKKIEELEENLSEAERRLESRTIRLDIENISGKKDLSEALNRALGELEGTFETD